MRRENSLSSIETHTAAATVHSLCLYPEQVDLHNDIVNFPFISHQAGFVGPAPTRKGLQAGSCGQSQPGLIPHTWTPQSVQRGPLCVEIELLGSGSRLWARTPASTGSSSARKLATSEDSPAPLPKPETTEVTSDPRPSHGQQNTLDRRISHTTLVFSLYEG